MLRPIEQAPTPIRTIVVSAVVLFSVLVSIVAIYENARGIAALRRDRDELVRVLELFSRDSVSDEAAIDAAREFLESSLLSDRFAPGGPGVAHLAEAERLVAAGPVATAALRSRLVSDELWELYHWYVPFLHRHAAAHNSLVGVFAVGLIAAVGGALVSQVRLRSTNRDRRRLHALARNQINLIELEQRSMMLELHDSVGQHLAVARMMIASVQEEVRGNERVRWAIEECSRAISNSHTQIRRIARRLHPAELDQIGLASAIVQLVEDLRDVFPGQITVDVSKALDRRVSRHARIQVYRVVQEALTNAVTHSNASSITVRLEDVGDTVWAVVADDGVGFRYQDENQSGFGILSMSERADIIDGTLAVLSRPGEGTMVSLQLPARGGATHGDDAEHPAD